MSREKRLWCINSVGINVEKVYLGSMFWEALIPCRWSFFSLRLQVTSESITLHSFSVSEKSSFLATSFPLLSALAFLASALNFLIKSVGFNCSCSCSEKTLLILSLENSVGMLVMDLSVDALSGNCNFTATLSPTLMSLALLLMVVARPEEDDLVTGDGDRRLLDLMWFSSAAKGDLESSSSLSDKTEGNRAFLCFPDEQLLDCVKQHKGIKVNCFLFARRY